MDSDTFNKIETVGPDPKEIMKFHMEYLQRVSNLNKQERRLFCSYMKSLGMVRYIVDPSKINMKDFIGPGDIIRTQP